MRYNTHTSWRTTSTIQANGDQHHFFIQIPILYLARFCFILFTQAMFNSGVNLVDVLIYIPSFNFVSTLNKSLRFTRFRRSYVNCPAVVLVKVTLLFCLMCAVHSGHVPYFCSCLSPTIVHLCNLLSELTCCSNVVSSKVGKQTKRCEIVIPK